MKTVQCESCGRIRVGNDWVRDSSIAPDTTGMCATCAAWKHKAHERKRQAEIRRLRRCDFELPKLANPFDAIKYDSEKT